MKIAVIGATGDTGRHLLKLAVEDGHDVTALARTPSKLAGIDKIQVFQADGTDPASLGAAMQRLPALDALVSIIGASTIREARKVTDLYSVSTRNLIAACTHASMPRLVVVSSAGVVPQPNDAWFYVHVLKRFFLQPMYDDMTRMEALLADSDLSWTIVRPPYLTKGPPTGNYRVSIGRNFDDDRSLRRGDLAHFLLRAVVEPEPYRRQRVALSE